MKTRNIAEGTSAGFSLKTKLTGLGVFLSVVCPLVMAVFGYRSFSHYIQWKQEEAQNASTASAAAQTRSFLQEKTGIVRRLAAGAAVDKYSTSFNRQQLLKYFSKFSSTFSCIGFVNSQGVQEVSLCKGEASEAVADVSGNAVFGLSRNEPNQVHIGGPRYDESTQEFVLDFAFQRKNYFDEVEGGILASVPLSNLTKELTSAFSGQSGSLMIIDREGTVFESSDILLVGAKAEMDRRGRELLRRALAGEDRIFGEFALFNLPHFGSMKAVDGYDLIVMFSLNSNDFTTPIAAIRKQFFLALAITVLLGVAVSNLLGRVLIKSLESLALVSADISKSMDLSKRVEVVSTDEIGLLGRSFNTMLVRLEESRNEMLAASAKADKLLRILKGMVDGLVVLKPDGAIISGNAAAARMLGCRGEEELAGVRLELESESGKREDLLSVQVVMQESIEHYEGFLLTKRGAKVPVSLSAAVIPHSEKESPEIVCLFKDITEQLEARQALKQARQAAEEASRAKSDFLAAMSHEIRTPMNGVLGMLDLLLHSELPERQAKFAATAYRSAELLLSVLNDILDLSKIEAGRLKLEVIGFNPRQAVEEAMDLFAETIHSKGLELLCRMPPDLPVALRGDPTRLRQVLSNLLGNAIKFTEQGEIEVRAWIEETAEESVFMRFEVRDTGIGIPDNAKKSIFDCFTQAENSTTRKFGGTGLGLTICKQLVEMMGGEIGVESVPGKGSTFWFTAYFGRESDCAEFSCPAPELLKGSKALVVDDNETNREILSNQLAAWEIEADVAESGVRAIEMLRKASASGRPYSLALLDLIMPNMDGIDLAERIEGDPMIPKLGLLILSSDGLPGEADRLRAPGVSEYLSKPFRQSLLHDAIASALGKLSLPRTVGIGASTELSAPLNASVLLVEDNRVNQEVAVEMLRNLGCSAESAFDGREALEILAKKNFDIILMDCMMPVMDGYQASREIRRLEESSGGREHKTIIALTANAMEGDRANCLAAGMDDHLSKPFNMNQLGSMLGTWLGTRGEGRRHLQKAVDLPMEKKTQLAEKPADPAPSARSALLDPQALQALRALRRKNGPDVLRNVIEAYLTDSPGILASMSRAVALADAGAIRRAAHSLKSSSAFVGAVNLSEQCKVLETKARENQLDDATKHLSAIEIELEIVKRALAEELK